MTPASRQLFDVDGATVGVTRVASSASRSGRAIFLHGNPGSAEDLMGLATTNRIANECLLVDTPGFAGLPRPERGLGGGLFPLARVVVEVAARHGWDRYSIWGHSHGCGVALATAHLTPTAVERLVLLGTFGRTPHPSYRQLSLPGLHALFRCLVPLFRTAPGRALARALVSSIARQAYHPTPYQPAWSASLQTQFTRFPETLLSMTELTLDRPWLEVGTIADSLPHPVLFLHGTHDRIVPIRFARALHEGRRALGLASEFVEFEDGGHQLAETHTERVHEAVERWARSTITAKAG